MKASLKCTIKLQATRGNSRSPASSSRSHSKQQKLRSYYSSVHKVKSNFNAFEICGFLATMHMLFLIERNRTSNCTARPKEVKVRDAENCDLLYNYLNALKQRWSACHSLSISSRVIICDKRPTGKQKNPLV